jgi:aminoglycoside 6'-N-acetyltransferase
VPDDPDFSGLRTARLKIRRFHAEDAAAFAAYRSDPDVARYQSWDACTPDQAEAFINEMAASRPGVPGEWFQFAVVDPASDGLLGDVALRVDGDDTSRAELGITFARAHHGKGLATEAARALTSYGFEQLGADTVFAIADARNDASITLLERIGMRRTATEHVRFKGEWCDEHTYELARDRG